MSVLIETYDLEDNTDAMKQLVDEMRRLGYNQRTAQQIEINDALALSKAGDLEGAAAAIERFEGTMEGLPMPRRLRRRIDAQIEGLMALGRRDIASAARNLQAALDANPAPDVKEDAVQIRFFLGQALWETDRRDEAAEVFRAVEQTGLARVNQPGYWVRSLWYLGSYHAEHGDSADAERYFSKFLDYWGDGELDRDKVASAQQFLNR